MLCRRRETWKCHLSTRTLNAGFERLRTWRKWKHRLQQDHSLLEEFDSLTNIIWVCLKIGYTPNYSHLVGIMIINHWVIGYTIFRQILHRYVDDVMLYAENLPILMKMLMLILSISESVCVVHM